MKRVNNKDKDTILMPKTKKNEKVTLTKEQVLDLMKSTSKMHPTAEQRKDLKNVSKEEFTRYVRKCGSSGHIGVSKHWVNKYVKVTMEEILD